MVVGVVAMDDLPQHRDHGDASPSDRVVLRAAQDTVGEPGWPVAPLGCGGLIWQPRCWRTIHRGTQQSLLVLASA